MNLLVVLRLNDASGRSVVVATVLAFLFPFSIPASALDEDDAKLWRASMELLLSTDEPDEENAWTRGGLNQEVIERLQEKPAFAEFMRKELRTNPNPKVRTYTAIMLATAFRAGAAPEIIYCLGDPDPEIRQMAGSYLLRYKIETARPVAAATLFTQDKHERKFGVRAVATLMKEEGITYLAIMLTDHEAEVACEAARGFEVCTKEDAAPYLLRYLQTEHAKESRRVVLESVLRTLHRLYGEPVPQQVDVPAATARWISRLKSDVERNLKSFVNPTTPTTLDEPR
jgi:hypothetical protein